MCCIDKLLDFSPTSMPDLGISLDTVFYQDFDIDITTKNVYVVFDLPDIPMPNGPRYIIKKLSKGVAYNRAHNELYVWLTDDDLLKMQKSRRVLIQVKIYDIFDLSMVSSAIQQVNIDPIIKKRCTYSTSFNEKIVDDLRSTGKIIKLDKTKSVEFTVDAKDGDVERFMSFLKYGDCNQNAHDDAIDALRYASKKWMKEHDIIGKVTHIEETQDGLKFTIEKEKPMKTKKDVDRIVITKNDLNEVLLRAYSGDEIVEKTIAKCNPNDIFDFNIGAKLAVDRLYDGYDMTPKPKRKLYTGKIFTRAIRRELGYYWFMSPEKYKYENQVNKIFEVVDGKILGLETRVEDIIYDDMNDDVLCDILRKTNRGSGRMFLEFIDGYFVR